MRTLVVFLIAAGSLGVATALTNQPVPLRHHLVASAVAPEVSVETLIDAADVIAIVQPTGNDFVHWNNASNTRWESDRGRAMIYNDQEVIVVAVMRGTAPDRLTIRNVGGVVGDTRYELEGLEALRPDRRYVVLLEQVDTPTQSGVETAISFVAQGQGVFEISRGSAVNALGDVLLCSSGESCTLPGE